ncbi:MAG: TatD family hydrolase [Thermoplasmatales archaeon]|nr:TatD family hydrolase [Thermoplasmatales archaeon]
MKIFDNHVHVKHSAVEYFFKTFTRAGGTSINLVNLTEDCFSLEDFEKKYHETISISEVLKARSLEVVVTIGPYPVNYIEMKEKVGRDRSIETYRRATDLAIKLVGEGKANAIGEVGRPHFETGADVIEDSNSIMEYIFQSTSDSDIPVILHTESLDSTGMCDIMNLAKKNGKNSNVVKHFSSPIFNDNCGLVPSVPAGRKNARAAPWGQTGFFFETDFAGDESNPNFVLPADSVPKRVSMLIQEGVEEEKVERSMSFYRDFYRLK